MYQSNQKKIYTFKYVNQDSNKNILYKNMIKRYYNNQSYNNIYLIKLLKNKYNNIILSKL